MCVWIPYLAATYFLKPKPFPSYRFLGHFAIKSRPFIDAITDFPSPETVEKAWTIIPHPDYDISVAEIPPIDESLRKGIALCPLIKPEKRPGFWFVPKGMQKEMEKGEKVIMHMHAGSMVAGHPMGEGPMYVPGYPAENRVRMFSTSQPDFANAGIGYRKCLTPDTAMPAALLDILGGYMYLTKTMDIPAADIMFCGESAGGSLAVLLSQYLHLLDLPQPGRMGMMSPIFDFSFDMNNLTDLWTKNQEWDFYGPNGFVAGRNSAMRYYTDEATRSYWFSPCFAPSEHWNYLAETGVKVHIVYSTREVMATQISMWVNAIRKAGVDVVEELVSPL